MKEIAGGESAAPEGLDAGKSPGRLQRLLRPGRRTRRSTASRGSRRGRAVAAELEEMHRDIAALWLAFGQHERMIRQALAQLERLGAPPIATLTFEPEPEAAASGPAQAESSDPTQPSISDQLSDLDQVLAAIEQATQTLERSYADEIATPEEESPAA